MMDTRPELQGCGPQSALSTPPAAAGKHALRAFRVPGACRGQTGVLCDTAHGYHLPFTLVSLSRALCPPGNAGK